MSALQTLTDRVSAGGTLQDEDAAEILRSHDLIAIGTIADDVRRQLHGARTTFVRVFEMHVEAVPAVLPAGTSAGEFRIVGRPASVDAACAAVAAARNVAASAHLTAFSLADLADLEGRTPGTFGRLRDAGLDGVAEAPIDRPETGAAVQRARADGLLVQRLTVNAPPDDPIALIGSVRDLQESVGEFRVFAPLPRSVPAAAPATGYDDVKLVAVARLLVRDIPSIQVDWPLYGPKLAQVALTFGADDVDGIAAVEPGALGTRRSAIEEIKGNIRAAGFEPAERDGRYELR